MIAIQPVAELGLLLACARTRLRDEDRRAIDAALASGLDWARLLRLARWHGLRPLLHRHLSAAGHEAVPRAMLVELWGEAETIARHNRAMHGELGRVCAILEAAGIAPVPYKGPTLALKAYGDLSMREFGDLDILVSQAQVLAARDALCEAGYGDEYPLQPQVRMAFMASGAQYHWVLRSQSHGHLLELHWKTDPDFPVERVEEPEWWQSTVRAGALREFPHVDLLLVLCIHGSKHGWSSLGWLVDVAELLPSPDSADWGLFCGRARELGCERRVGVGLRLAAGLIGVPLGRQARDLADRADVIRAADTVLAPILAPEPDSPGVWQGLRQGLAMVERPRQRIGLVLRAVFLPSLVEWMRWPLPRPLFFAYPVLRMGRLAGKYTRRVVSGAFSRRRLHP